MFFNNAPDLRTPKTGFGKVQLSFFFFSQRRLQVRTHTHIHRAFNRDKLRWISILLFWLVYPNVGLSIPSLGKELCAFLTKGYVGLYQHDSIFGEFVSFCLVNFRLEDLQVLGFRVQNLYSSFGA